VFILYVLYERGCTYIVNDIIIIDVIGENKFGT